MPWTLRTWRHHSLAYGLFHNARHSAISATWRRWRRDSLFGMAFSWDSLSDISAGGNTCRRRSAGATAPRVWGVQHGIADILSHIAWAYCGSLVPLQTYRGIPLPSQPRRATHATRTGRQHGGRRQTRLQRAVQDVVAGASGIARWPLHRRLRCCKLLPNMAQATPFYLEHRGGWRAASADTAWRADAVGAKRREKASPARPRNRYCRLNNDIAARSLIAAAHTFAATW